MSRDLFEATVVARPKPKRARWIVVASVFAHVGVIALVLIGPILSAADGIVALARGVVYSVPATPQAPASPPKTSAAAPSINPNAAPPRAPENPVTHEVPVGSDRAGPAGLRIAQYGTDTVPGAPSDAPSVKLAPPEPPPVKRPLEPVEVGGQIRAPQRIAYVAPAYPAVALSAKIEAEVTIEATIDEQGIVRNVRAVRPNALFEKAAMEAVSQWKYEPTRLNGQVVPVILTVIVKFEIRR